MRKKFPLSLLLLLGLFLAGLPGATTLSASAGSLPANSQTDSTILVADLSGRMGLRPPAGPRPDVVAPVMAKIQTVPPFPNVTLQIDGRQYLTGPDGSAIVQVGKPGSYVLQVDVSQYHDPYKRIEFARWMGENFQPALDVHVPTNGNESIQVGINVYELVGQTFVDLNGKPVDPHRVTQFTIKSIQGDTFTFSDGQPRWIPASRVTRRRVGGLDQVPLLYTVTSAIVDGSNTVNKAQQQFFAKPNGTWTIQLLFYTLRIQAADALFGFPQGTSVALLFPNGQVKKYPLDASGSVQIDSLARGDYAFQLSGIQGIRSRVPVALSKDQQVNTRVITFLDLAVVGGAALAVAILLVLFGRSPLFRTPLDDTQPSRPRVRLVDQSSLEDTQPSRRHVRLR